MTSTAGGPDFDHAGTFVADGLPSPLTPLTTSTDTYPDVFYYSAWWTYAAPTAGVLEINTYASSYDYSIAFDLPDTEMAILVSPGDPPTGVVAFNDDTTETVAPDLIRLSHIKTTVIGGVTYAIKVGNFGSATGSLTAFSLTGTFIPAGPAPACRKFPREDGQGVGSARHFPAPRSLQASPRRAGGYY